MLVSLHVKNLALIQETEVFFVPHLNILTGETGAGKSIIIGSVCLALGGRGDRDLIRTGADYALIELVFQLEKEGQIEYQQGKRRDGKCKIVKGTHRCFDRYSRTARFPAAFTDKKTFGNSG